MTHPRGAHDAALLDLPLPAGRLRFQRLGQGPDVVFLHGLLGMGAQWQPLAARLAPRCTCWLLELPGLSASDPIADMSLPGLRRWLEQALAGLGLRRFDLVGASWGGGLALEFALASPWRTRLRRLVLAAPIHPYWSPAPRQRLLLSSPWTQLAAATGAWLPHRLAATFLAMSFGDPARMPPGSVARYRALLRQPGLAAAVRGCARTLRPDLARIAAALASPSPLAGAAPLLLWGSRDRIVPAATAERLCRHLPAAHLRLLPGLGHLAFEEAPDAFAAALGGAEVP